jgi:hypothetical protein
VIIGEAEMMGGVQPAVISMTKASERSDFNHWNIHFGGELPPVWIWKWFCR